MKKTVLITGGSRGIGMACAILFSMKGYNVAINYNSSHDKAEKLAEDINANAGNARIYKADIASFDAVRTMFKNIEKDFGGIDVLVNNAGISLNEVFTEVTPESWKRLCAVNLDGCIFCSQLAIPLMLKKHSGRVINISSVWGVHGGSCEAHYSATKAAIIGLTKALSKEYGGSGICVNCIAPGVIETDMNMCYDAGALEKLKEKTPLQRLGTVTDVANAVLFLADERSDFITGQVLGVDGGFC